MIAAEQTRWPFFIIAGMLAFAAIALEVGSTFFLTASSAGAAASTRNQLGIPSLWLIDVILGWFVLKSAIAPLNKNFVARTQGIVSLVLAIVVIFAAIKTLISAFVLLMVMIALIGSFFGFIAYLILFGTFQTTDASVILGTITLFKLGFAAFLVFAQQGFMKSKGLIVLLALSLAGDLLLNLLHGLVPGIFVSVTDAVGAIIIAIVALVYAVFEAIWAIVAIVRAII